MAGTCNDYVMNNPAAFTQTYFEIASIRVFTNNGNRPLVTRDAAAYTAEDSSEQSNCTEGIVGGERNSTHSGHRQHHHRFF